jgi:hypothetical protein
VWERRAVSFIYSETGREIKDSPIFYLIFITPSFLRYTICLGAYDSARPLLFV